MPEKKSSDRYIPEPVDHGYPGNETHNLKPRHATVVCEARKGGVGDCENDRGIEKCGQARKSVWGMSRHQKAMKGAEDCEKPV